jgi:hypothetical protein
VVGRVLCGRDVVPGWNTGSFADLFLQDGTAVPSRHWHAEAAYSEVVD